MKITYAPSATRGVSKLMMVGEIDAVDKKSIPWLLVLLALGAAYFVTKK